MSNSIRGRSRQNESRINRTNIVACYYLLYFFSLLSLPLSSAYSSNSNSSPSLAFVHLFSLLSIYTSLFYILTIRVEVAWCSIFVTPILALSPGSLGSPFPYRIRFAIIDIASSKCMNVLINGSIMRSIHNPFRSFAISGYSGWDMPGRMCGGWCYVSKFARDESDYCGT